MHISFFILTSIRSLPYHAVPVMVLIRKDLPGKNFETPLYSQFYLRAFNAEMNAVRKIMKDPLRDMVIREWQKRHGVSAAPNQKSKL